VPSGYDPAEHRAMAERVASRLEETARLIRERGIGALGGAHGGDELTRLIAAVAAGFFAREQ
jgi:hypothetical protein